MNRFVATAALALLALTQAACSANTKGEQQTLVDRATLTVEDMMTQTVSEDPQKMLRNAKGALICPRIFKAGFFFGGEGGNCVMLARAGNGTWSYPAFYTIGSGSFGFQFGIQDSQLFMLIMTQKGLNAVLDSQIKLGASASVAVATIGAGIQGSTTAAVGADIVAFSASRGLFGGVSLEGSVMSTQTDWNQSYYGHPFAARQLVMGMEGSNPGADPLRDLLTRYGSSQAQAPMPVQQQSGYAPPYPQYQTQPSQGMQQPMQPQAPMAAQQQPGYAPPYAQYQTQPSQGMQPQQLSPSVNNYSAAAPSGGRGPIQQQNLTPPSR